MGKTTSDTMEFRVLGMVLLVASAIAVRMEESSQMSEHESASMAVMSKLGLRDVQENVDKDLWEARQAEASADDEDEEIARLLAELEGLDAEKAAAEKEAKQKEIEVKEATAAKLKEVAKHKFEVAKAAIDAKAKRVEEVAQNAQPAGMTEKTKELEVAAKKAAEEADKLAAEAGAAGEASKLALKNAAEVKTSADTAIALEKETRTELLSDGLQWVAGPIFDKMKKLCDLDYPTFRKEYRKVRASPTYKAYRWDIKKACPKAANDDLENMTSEEEEAARLAAEEANQLKNVHAPPQDTSKAYPHSNTHWAVPADGKVQKWCTTQYGAVPCSMLKKAKEAGLLGDIKVDDKSQKALNMLELEDKSFDDDTPVITSLDEEF